ncbi:hypothetical protein FB567DRAFT_71690 [Paraphoma chrysanthemicola]|uniref:Uncharacterized protein n=1 Tax=Paraphoma chrysanthemicola TaxID=798071 RepID=A0A8K0R2Y0_9PLEO|nr:hypothetical protein FB567DRAFT_71690 [Paraphoma chrysanthemicola]
MERLLLLCLALLVVPWGQRVAHGAASNYSLALNSSSKYTSTQSGYKINFSQSLESPPHDSHSHKDSFIPNTSHQANSTESTPGHVQYPRTSRGDFSAVPTPTHAVNSNFSGSYNLHSSSDTNATAEEHQRTTLSTAVSSSWSGHNATKYNNITTVHIITSTRYVATNFTSNVTATPVLPASNATSATLTCPITTYSGMPAIREIPGCDFDQAYIDDMFFYDYADRCVASSCSVSLWDALWTYSGPIPTITTTMTIPDLTMTFTNNSYYVHYGTPITKTLIFNGSILDAVPREDPCCGRCSMGVKALEVFYWPDQATAKPEESRETQSLTLGPPNDKQYSFVDDTGFTFVSPSVYLVFSSLRARDKCGTVGQDIHVTTMAFDADEISTIRASTWITEGCGYLGLAITSSITSVPITFADLQGNCTTPNAPWMEWHPDDPMAYMNTADPCHP